MEIRKFIKRYAKVALFSFLASPLWAGDILISKFGGLNTQDSSVAISQEEAQDLLNVNITPGGRSVYKRDGYGLYKTLSVSTSPVHGGYHFQDTTGNDIQLWGNDQQLSASVSGAAFTVIVSSDTFGATWQCADTQGYAYCANSSRDTVIKTAGTTATTTFETNIPKGTMVAFSPDRLIVSGVSGSENSIYFSQANTFNNFTLGALTSSSFTEVIAAPGSRITHIRYAFGKLFWWKDQSFGFFIFQDQFSAQVVIISDQIGTLDNSSAYWNGQIYFRGQDNQFYSFDGNSITRLSRGITPTVTQANRRKANSWTQTTASDFGSGSSVFIDSSTWSGDLKLTGMKDDFSSFSGWRYTDYSTVNNGFGTGVSTGSFLSSSGVLTCSNPAGSGQCANAVFGSTISINQNLYIQESVKLTSTTTLISDSYFYIGVSNSNSKGYMVKFGSSTTYPGKLVSLLVSTDYTKSHDGLGATGDNQLPGVSVSSSTAIDTNFHTVDLKYSATGYMEVRIDGIFVSSGADTTYQNMSRAYMGWLTDAPSHSQIDYYYLTSSTGTYYSSVNNSPNLTTWGTYSGTQQLNGGTLSYFVRSSTSPFSISSTTPTWVAQTNGANVAASTGTYEQTRIDFAVTGATQNPTVSDFSFNWFEGSASDKSYIQYFNDAVWFSVSLGTSTTNNRVFRLDLLNNAWLLDDIASNGFLVDNNTIYIGDPSLGKTYRFGGSTSDNGNSINSYWKSKDFVGDDPFVRNEYLQNDFIVKKSSGTTLTATYTVEASTPTSYSLNLYGIGTVLRKSNNLPSGKIGGFYNIKFGDNSSNASWEVLGFRTRFNTLAWRPEQ